MATAEIIKANSRYQKWEEKAFSELDTALHNILSGDVVLQKAGIKKMLSYSTQELGGRSLPVREWFLNHKNREQCFGSIKMDMPAKLISDLFRCFHFVCERLIDHSVMWADFPSTQETIDYKDRLHQTVLQFTTHPSADVRVDVAYCLALLGDTHAWDIYTNTVQKKSSCCAWLRAAIKRYSAQSITDSQKQKLKSVLLTIENKSNNPSVKRNARLVIDIIEEATL